MTGIESTMLGGVQLQANGDCIKSAKKLDNGKYQVIFKNGEVITYNEQKNNRASIYCSDSYGDITCGYLEGAILTGSANASSSITMYGGKDNVVDVSQNNKQDSVYVSDSKNIRVKTDNQDDVDASMELKNTGKYKKFSNYKKAGTYTYSAGDSFIKRANVPQALLSEYDNIAKQNGNKLIDTVEEISKFKEAAQTAFQKQKVTKKDVEKMGFTVHDKPESPHTAENYALTGGIIGSVIGLGIPVVSQITGAAGLIIGGVAGGAVEVGKWTYDKVTGIKDDRVLNHWGID